MIEEIRPTTTANVQILSDASNAWVIQTPGRNYPAAVMQRDSLYHLQFLASKVQSVAQRTGTEELQDPADELKELLDARVTRR